MIKAVLFDYGGVIKMNRNFFMDIRKIYNISEEKLKQIEGKRLQITDHAQKNIISDEDFWCKLSELIGKPVPDNSVELAQKYYRETFVFYTEIFNLVKKLKTQGIRTAILSNIFKFEAKVIREYNGYDEFDPVILSYEVGMAKPDLEIYNFTLKKLKLKPEECIFIDDKEMNLVPAREIGMKTVLAENPEQIAKDVFSIIDSQNFYKLADKF